MSTTQQPTRWYRLEIGISVLGVVVTAVVMVVFAIRAETYQSALTSIEEDRHQTEIVTGEATDFVMTYFGARCDDRVEMMDFPLTQWFNWRPDTTMLRFERGEDPEQFLLPASATDVTVSGDSTVAGKVQTPGEAEAVEQEVETAMTRRRDAIQEAWAAGYTQSGDVGATTRGPVLQNCKGGRSELTELYQPDIPTEIIRITELADGEVAVVVNVAIDRIHMDHVADDELTMAIHLVRSEGELRLKSIAGLESPDPNAVLLRELCALIRAQVELDPNFGTYPEDAKAGVDEKCREVDPD